MWLFIKSLLRIRYTVTRGRLVDSEDCGSSLGPRGGDITPSYGGIYSPQDNETGHRRNAQEESNIYTSILYGLQATPRSPLTKTCENLILLIVFFFIFC